MSDLEWVRRDGVGGWAAESGGSPSPVLSTSVTLSQADIQALPTTDFVIVAGQTDSLIVPIWLAMQKAFSVSYTNFNANASLEIAYPDHNATTWLNFLDAFGPQALADYFTSGPPRMTVFSPLAVYGQSTDPDRSNYPEEFTTHAAALGADLVTYILNHGDGDLSGGDPGDILMLNLLYTVIPYVLA